MKLLLAAVLVAAALLIGRGSPDSTAPVGRAASVVGVFAPLGMMAARTLPRLAGTNMTYHGGWVMRLWTNTTYAIYWSARQHLWLGRSYCSGYEQAINGYLKDVAAASGSDSNVHSVDTEYSDTTGPIAYQSTFGGWAVAHSAFPNVQPELQLHRRHRSRLPD